MTSTPARTPNRMLAQAGLTGPRLARVGPTVLRFGLAALWLAAGILKIGDPQGMVHSVRAFRILPESLVHPVAYAVPFVEIALGLLLLVGLAVRVGAVVSALLLAVYIAAIASAAARGLHIECGCFSAGGNLTADAPTHYAEEIIRDSLLLLASGLLVRWPASAFAIDRLLDRPFQENP
ncbi:MauE/DoxX family redox-associated membrane protein [Frankia sp. Cppng1_Ct_nod]|uniref:MauE/DoxX family redox-associated membrane protein n=1 Tax=Frankia sp. Cppng1_Ct_nod TaxID=2897162 RepID=UPI0032E9FB98